MHTCSQAHSQWATEALAPWGQELPAQRGLLVGKPLHALGVGDTGSAFPHRSRGDRHPQPAHPHCRHLPPQPLHSQEHSTLLFQFAQEEKHLLVG